MENDKRVRLRINLINGEFEIDGNSDFIIEHFGERINSYLDIIQSDKGINKENAIIRPNPNKSEILVGTIPDNFGEYFNKFSKSISNVDKLLIASYFIQSTQESKSFLVKDASDLLIEQGIKLSNSAAFNNLNLNTKRIFKLTGKAFRVSDIGKEYIKNLLNNS